MLFETGKVLMTRGVNDMVADNTKFAKFMMNSLKRHCNGDWGDLCDDDKGANDFALRNGDDRLFSKYDFDDETSIYIITEWDRSATTILFPEEY